MSRRPRPAALVAAASVALAQPPGNVPTFPTGTELVYVRFHVEKKGGYVGGVTKEQLRVLEDGRPQTIALLETPSTRERTIPPDVILVLDVSSSVMDERLLDEAVVKNVLFASLSAQARVGLCAFGGELRCPTPPTRDADAVLAGFRQAMEFAVESRGSGTRLYGSLTDVVRQGDKEARTQRALVVFSDGLENQGGHVKETIEAAADADVRVYAVKVSQAFQATARGTGPFGGTPNRAMYDYKKFELDRLAAETGGRTWEPGTLDEKELAKILREIATLVSMENLVGYQPDGPPTGKKRRVKVELVDKSVGSIRDGERTLVR